MSEIDPAQFAKMVAALVANGWVDVEQSNGAPAFVREFYRRRPAATWAESAMVPKLVDIILKYNADPHDADLVGTVIALLDLPWLAQPQPEIKHGWTAHGHACCRIEPRTMLGTRPSSIARCGGPALCGKCGSDAARIHMRT